MIGAVRAPGRAVLRHRPDEQQHPRRHRRHRRRRLDRHPVPARDLGRPAGLLDLRRRGRRTQYTAFASKKGQAVTARLIVRRVRDLNKKAADGQDELFPVWRYHAVFTDSPFELVQAEGHHRDHAVVEQVFADVTSGPLAHMPSGVFAANAAWLSIAAMAHNLLRAAGALASLPFAKARGRDDPPRPDRGRRPHRPARQGPPHPPPARGLAPRAGMAEPLGRGLRAARRSGLTSPEPVRTPTAPAATRTPSPSPGTQDKPHSRRAAGRPRPESPRKTPRAGIKPETSYPNWPVDRG